MGHLASWVKTEREQKWAVGGMRFCSCGVMKRQKSKGVYSMVKNIIEIMHDKKMEKRLELGITRYQGVSGFPFSQSGIPSESLKIQKDDPFMPSEPMIYLSLTS